MKTPFKVKLLLIIVYIYIYYCDIISFPPCIVTKSMKYSYVYYIILYELLVINSTLLLTFDQ